MEKKTFNMIGFALFAMAIATTAGQILIAVILTVINPTISTQPWLGMVLIAGFYIFGVPVFYLFVKALPVGESLEHEKITLKKVIAYFLVCLGATYLFNIFGIVINLLISFLKGSAIANPLEQALTNVNPLITLLIAGILSPIFEEIVFRKLLVNRLRPFGDKVAIIFSAIMFGLYHMNLSQFFYAVAVGVILAYATLKTGTIKLAIILHILVNITGSILMPMLINLGALGSIISVVLLGTFIVSGCAVLFSYKEKIHLLQPQFSFSMPITNKLQYLNAGTIIFILFCVVMIVSTALV